MGRTFSLPQVAARPISDHGGLHAFCLRGNHQLRYGRGRVASRFVVEGVTGRGTPRWTSRATLSAPSKPNFLKQSGAGTFPWCVRHTTSSRTGSWK